MRLIPLALVAALLGGCAVTGGDRLAVCDGKHRRPANPNGSVLSPSAAERPQASADVSAPPPRAAVPIGSCR